jgi:hypothetical protein
MLDIFLASLPLEQDPDESKICSAGLCDLVEKGTIRLDVKHRDLVRIIGATLAGIEEGEELASTETCARFAGILFRMQRDLQADLINRAFSEIPLESQHAVNSLMAQYAPQFANVVTP